MTRSLRAALAAALFGVASVSSAQAVELRALSSWDQTFPARTVLLDQYTKNVTEASGGDITFLTFGPETAPPFEQLQPVSAGAFQLLVTNAAYHFGVTPFLVPAEAFRGDIRKWRESGFKELVDKHYAKYGLKLLALARSPEGTAYQMILRNPVGPTGDLRGRKIRGSQSYGGIISMLGASTVVLPPAEIYPALEKGVVDGAAWPTLGVLANKWDEVAKYLLRPSFGIAIYPVLMNVASWEKLTDKQKTIMLEQGTKIEDIYYAEWNRLAKEEEAALIKRGAQITEMGAEQKQKLMASWAETLWETAGKQRPDDIKELREFARAKGLAE